MPADLLMVCPTRGRPHNAEALWESWQATTTGAADLLFAVDDDDPMLWQYRDVVGRMPGVLLHVGPRLRMVGTLNGVAVANAPKYQYLGFLGDDHRPRSAGWQDRFIEALSVSQSTMTLASTVPVNTYRIPCTGFVYGNDLLQGEKMPTALAMTSDIVTALGYMAPSTMIHLCIDLVWLELGRAIDRITYLPDVIVEHVHPALGKAPMDAGYEDANSAERISADSAAYFAYMAGQFHDDVAKLKALL
jgi:hypothetical protein